MWSDAFRRGRIGLLLALLVSAAFAGCFGDEEVPDPPGANDGTGGTGGGLGPGASAEPIPTTGGSTAPKNKTEQVPEAHYHHYWGDPPLEEMLIFEDVVTLDHAPCLDADSQQHPPCFGQQAHVGSVTFTLEDDGNQVNDESREPHLDGHADTVFTGTSTIVATFSWSDDDLVGSALRFYYKPANSPMFLPRQDQPPILVTPEDPKVEIPVGPGMADPAHQFRVSRWAFMLVAEGGPQPDWQLPVRFARGDVTVEMVAKNGGKQSIDPPHPDQWAGQDVLRFGSVSGDFQIASVRAENQDPEVDHRVAQGDGGEDDIEMPLKAVVPAGTEKLVVRAWVNATDEASKNLDWGLKYHGADTMAYTRVPTYTEEAGARVYEIFIADHETDPPYERQSYFRFGFYPVAGDQAENGFFQGDYTLAFEAHKDPAFTYNF